MDGVVNGLWGSLDIVLDRHYLSKGTVNDGIL